MRGIQAVHKQAIPRRRWRALRDAVVDIALFTGSAVFASNLAGGFHSAVPSAPAMLMILLCSVAATAILWQRGLYSVNPRYLGLHDFLNVGCASTAFGIPLPYIEKAFHLSGNAQGTIVVPVLAVFFAATALTTLRLARRTLAWGRGRENSGQRKHLTLIVGAGDAGEIILREFTRGTQSRHQIVGFVDDDLEKHAMRIHGVPVLGTIDDIPELVDRHNIEEILIAMPSALGHQIRRVFNVCAKTSARVRTLPGLSASLQGEKLTKHLREVEIDDLLRREPVQTDVQEISRYLAGEHVLITGGGGSIGSELARQVARIRPASLIVVGKGENSVYEIEQELLQTTQLVPIAQVADVRDRQAMERIFAKYRPTVVFHAAAHKHVPLMQKNPAEAIHNNIVGTQVTAELAVKYGVKKFILISTDKAVNPSSVMGATKRVCEMIVTGLGQSTETQFSAVRFGNVLGSRGSLIPLLKAQIRRGGPVTITHKDMTRFFMTIPEAVQLVTQAGALGKTGETFILDMGGPVKIEDLALELIRLHGLMPGDDIEVRYTGVRPGEKMHEELVYDAEALRSTTHPKIRMVGDQPRIDLRRLRRDIEHLSELCKEGDEDKSRQFLMELAWGKLDMPFHEPDPNDKKSYAR